MIFWMYFKMILGNDMCIYGVFVFSKIHISTVFKRECIIAHCIIYVYIYIYMYVCIHIRSKGQWGHNWSLRFPPSLHFRVFSGWKGRSMSSMKICPSNNLSTTDSKKPPHKPHKICQKKRRASNKCGSSSGFEGHQGSWKNYCMAGQFWGHEKFGLLSFFMSCLNWRKESHLWIPSSLPRPIMGFLVEFFGGTGEKELSKSTKKTCLQQMQKWFYKKTWVLEKKTENVHLNKTQKTKHQVHPTKPSSLF